MSYYSKLPDPSNLTKEDLKTTERVLGAMLKETRDPAVEKLLCDARNRVRYRMTEAGKSEARYEEHQRFLDDQEAEPNARHGAFLGNQLQELSSRGNEGYAEANGLVIQFIENHRGFRRWMPKPGTDTTEYRAVDGSWICRMSIAQKMIDVDRIRV